MSKQIPSFKELYIVIINDMYSFLLELSEYLELNKNINDIDKKISFLKTYLSDKNLYNKKNKDIIHLILNYIKHIEDCFNNNIFEDVIISDFCLAYLVLVGFRHIFVINFKKEELFSFNLMNYNKYSFLIEKYYFTQKIKQVYEKKVFSVKIENNNYKDLINLFGRNKIFYLLFDLSNDSIKQNYFNKKGKNIIEEIPNTNNLNKNNSKIYNSEQKETIKNNIIFKSILESIKIKNTISKVNDNSKRKQLLSKSASFKRRIPKRVAIHNTKSSSYTINNELSSCHIYFNYNNFKLYSFYELRESFTKESKGCKTIKEYINKFYFDSDGKLSTKNAYLIHNGEYLPNRVKIIHDKIIKEILYSADSPSEGKKPIAFLFGGGSGSGKTTVINSQIRPIIEKTGLKFASIDVDEIGKYLPEFKYFFKQNQNNASYRTHMESVYIRERAVNELIKRRKCFQLHGVMGNLIRYKDIILKLKQQGYEVHLVGITISTKEAIKRAKRRKDRYVEEDIIKQSHKNFTNTWIELCKDSGVDSFSLYDNSQSNGKPPTLIMDKNGIYEENLFNQFLEKGKEN